ncbi:hypothetical protein BKA65DRAFT_519887 [Rhexocercosporidium sp. MPI-PUGE-AT-0058]|nr:hypothetical protein BKA65DRAFT_519887 [Rhexocercosporidium sp. MPI-PUGE-AT-0058]
MLAAEAMADILVAVKRLLRLLTGNDEDANENREEQGLPLGEMDVEGVRHRTGPGQQPTLLDDGSEIQTPSGVLASDSSEELAQVQEDPELKDSFVKINLRRISTTFGSGRSAQEREAEEVRLYQERGYHKLIKERYEEAPDGFPRLAAFISSDDDCQIYRGFKTCHNRIILHCEVELMELEKQLHDLDKRDNEHPITYHRLKRIKHRAGWDEEQNILMDKMKVKLKEYDELVLRHAQMQALGRPPERVHKALFHWIWQNKPLAAGYWDFIRYEDDFLGIKRDKSSHLEIFIQDRLNTWPWKLMKQHFITEKERKKTDEKRVTYYSATRFKAFAGMLLVLTTVGILLTPVFLLFLIPMSRSLMAVTASIFIVLFSVVMSVVTGAEVYKVFVSTATYSAIVVMFLGNISAGNGPVSPST